MRALKGDEERPTFFIGMPRSGTSLMFAAFAAHRDLAWFSQYMDQFPGVPGMELVTRLTALAPSSRKSVARHGETRSLADRMRISPSEAYNVWRRCCGLEFERGYLLDTPASPHASECVRRRVRRTMRLQGKPRFAAKLTGPGRIRYLSSIFPQARFVNVIRDPRAVVDSLLRVPFWRETFRLHEPAWQGGLRDEEVLAWKRAGTPEALAAVQWRAVLRTTREEAAQLAAGSYEEVRYEEFIGEPRATLERMFEFAALADDSNAHAFVEGRLDVRDLSAGWRRRLSPDQIAVIEDLAGPSSSW